MNVAAQSALLVELRRLVVEIKEDENITNADGTTNYVAPRFSQAVERHADDGDRLVANVKRVLRKKGPSEGWNALGEADRLDLSVEWMVLKEDAPWAPLFTDEDRDLAREVLAGQKTTIHDRKEAAEADSLDEDRRIVGMVAASRRAKGAAWTPEIEATMLADRAAKRTD